MAEQEMTKEQGLEQVVELQQRAIQFAESGMVEEAIEAAVVSIGLLDEIDPENHLLRSKLMQNTSRVLLFAQDIEQAEAIANEGIELMQSLAQACPPDALAEAYLNYSSILFAKQDLDGAADILQEAMTLWEQDNSRPTAQSAACQMNLARIREEQGKAMEAVSLYQQAIISHAALLGDHEQTAMAWLGKSTALMSANDFVTARESLESALACCSRAGCLESEVAKACQQNLDICLSMLG